MDDVLRRLESHERDIRELRVEQTKIREEVGLEITAIRERLARMEVVLPILIPILTTIMTLLFNFLTKGH
jgi:hypothetical protein